MKQAVEDVPDEFGGLHLDSITITAEVNAKGQLALLGSGGEIGGKAESVSSSKSRLARARLSASNARPTGYAGRIA